MLSQLAVKISKLSSLYLITLLFLLTLVCYLNTFGNSLFYDDEQFIYRNDAVKTLNVEKIFTQSLVSNAGKVSNYFRPLLFLGFGIEYRLFGDNGFMYHFDSFVVHFLGGVFLYLFLLKLFKNKFLAFFTTLLFLIHPIQTEAVSYASGRGDPLSFLFCMIALYFFLATKKNAKLISCLFFVFALLSKEIAIILPGLIFITSYLFENKNVKKSFITALPYLTIAMCYFLLRITIFNFANTLNFYSTENIYATNIFVRLNTFLNIFPTYLQLLIFPRDLFIERDYSFSIYTKATITSILTMLCGTISFIISFKYKVRNPILLFSLCWVAICFIPTAGFIPINGILYEHFLYFPSVGFFLATTYGLFSLYKMNVRFFYVLFIVFTLCIFLLITRTIVRNYDWHDPIKFYTQTLSYVQSPRILNNLAMTYGDSGDIKNAIATYKKAISFNQAYPEPHYNLGNAYLGIQETSPAIAAYKEALRIDPSFYLAYVKLYYLYQSSSDKDGMTWVDKQLDRLGQINPSFKQLKIQLHQQ